MNLLSLLRLKSLSKITATFLMEDLKEGKHISPQHHFSFNVIKMKKEKKSHPNFNVIKRADIFSFQWQIKLGVVCIAMKQNAILP